MKIQNISNDDVLFYFGVLATRALLLPRFQFNGSKKGDKWGVKLTMYGHTIVKGIQYKSHKLAKVTICREALEKLKAEYADFTFPGHPQDKTPSSLDWVELLHGEL